MRFTLSCSLLAVQLALVNLVVGQGYTICNKGTKGCLVRCDSPQEKLCTRKGPGPSSRPPADAICFYENPRLRPDSVTKHAFFDLRTTSFAGVENPVFPGKRLTLIDQEYEWEVVTGGAEMPATISVPGKDYFWFDNGEYVDLEPRGVNDDFDWYFLPCNPRTN